MLRQFRADGRECIAWLEGHQGRQLNRVERGLVWLSMSLPPSPRELFFKLRFRPMWTPSAIAEIERAGYRDAMEQAVFDTAVFVPRWRRYPRPRDFARTHPTA